jgi:xanthine dehydrogenase accessory factor
MKHPEVLQAVIDAAAEGRRVALATVVRTRGSVPRHAGSRMVVDPGHGLVGTIGGGCGEAEVIEAAAEVITSRTPRVVRVELMDRVDSWSPAVCGGVMEIFLEPVHPTEPAP